MQIRHGDLLIEAIPALPQGLVRCERVILAEGETTGHAHRLEGVAVAVLDSTDARYCCVSNQGVLSQAECISVASRLNTIVRVLKLRGIRVYAALDGMFTGETAELDAPARALLVEGEAAWSTATKSLGLIQHEEHGVVFAPPGEYRVIRQHEYDPFERAARRVVD